MQHSNCYSILYHIFETLLLLSFFYLMVKSGKSFVKTGSCFQIALFFLFYRNFKPNTPPTHLFRVPRSLDFTWCSNIWVFLLFSKSHHRYIFWDRQCPQKVLYLLFGKLVWVSKEFSLFLFSSLYFFIIFIVILFP